MKVDFNKLYKLTPYQLCRGMANITGPKEGYKIVEDDDFLVYVVKISKQYKENIYPKLSVTGCTKCEHLSTDHNYKDRHNCKKCSCKFFWGMNNFEYIQWIQEQREKGIKNKRFKITLDKQ